MHYRTEKNVEFLSAGVRAGEILAECWGEWLAEMVPKWTASHSKSLLIVCAFLVRILQQQNELMYGEEGTCTLCSKTFARKSSLLTHIRNHTAERKYQCATCQKSMANLKRLEMNCGNSNDIDFCSIYTSGQFTQSWTDSHKFTPIRVRGLWQSIHTNHQSECELYLPSASTAFYGDFNLNLIFLRIIGGFIRANGRLSASNRNVDDHLHK